MNIFMYSYVEYRACQHIHVTAHFALSLSHSLEKRKKKKSRIFFLVFFLLTGAVGGEDLGVATRSPVVRDREGVD